MLFPKINPPAVLKRQQAVPVARKILKGRLVNEVTKRDDPPARQHVDAPPTANHVKIPPIGLDAFFSTGGAVSSSALKTGTAETVKAKIKSKEIIKIFFIDSSDNIIQNNILYKNRYGIYIEEGATNNTIHSNDFLENRVAANDTVGNRWSMEMKEEGLMGLLKGAKVIGNHYSDYDEPGEGCNDTNSDGFCDEPRTIRNGPGIDEHPLVAPINA